MAGTPGLHAHLNTLSATFWSRGRKLGIGLLDDAAAGQAVATPLARRRPAVAFEQCALRQIVAESQGYPYFLQLWGATLWEALRGTEVTLIDASLVAWAQPRFESERSAYYEDRREELKRLGLLDIGASMAPAFVATPVLTERELDAAVAAALPPDAAVHDVDEARDGLAAVGYVWKPPGSEDRWQPGIPSLMTYVAAHAER